MWLLDFVHFKKPKEKNIHKAWSNSESFFSKFSNKWLMMNSVFFSLFYWIIFSIGSICTSIILTASSLKSGLSKPVYTIHFMCLSLSIKSVPSDSLPDSLQFYSGVIQLKQILSVCEFTASQWKAAFTYPK